MEKLSFVQKKFDSFKDFYPCTNKDYILYYREEKDDNASLLTRNGNMNYTILNSTGKWILSNCSGKNTVLDIFILMKNTFVDVDEQILKKDLIKCLYEFTELYALFWKDQDGKKIRNPIIDSKNIVIDKNSEVCLATENDIRELLVFFKEYQKKSNNIIYVWEDSYKEYKEEVVLRQYLYSFSHEFYLYKKNNKIEGVVVAKQDSSKFINSSKLTFISIPKNIFSNMLHEMKKYYFAYANKNINLLTVRISPIMKDYKIIKNLLEDNNFLLSGMTKKEYLNNDLENYVLYILDEEC